MPRELTVIYVPTKATASEDGQRIVLGTYPGFSGEIMARVEAATPAEAIEHFRHALEEAAQARRGGNWLAVPLSEDPPARTPRSLSPSFALLPLDALSAAMQSLDVGR